MRQQVKPCPALERQRQEAVGEAQGTHQEQQSSCGGSGGHRTLSETLLEAPSGIKQGPLPQIKPWHSTVT